MSHDDERSRKTELPSLSPNKRLFFKFLVVILFLLAWLVAGELILRIKHHRIQTSDDLEAGMITKDPVLGWKLTPDWQGRHGHLEFEVSYSINKFGFRGKIHENKGVRRTYAIVGDSFTFGLGVEEDETFVHRLNEGDFPGNFLNFGIPGFSTDQEGLLIERRIMDFRPDAILLVVYLANDFFDNLERVPMQVNLPKPKFEVDHGELRLILPENGIAKNETSRPSSMHENSLMSVNGSYWSKLHGVFDKFHIFRLLAPKMGLNMYHSHSALASAFEAHLKVFELILARIRDFVNQREMELSLVLLPGRSFVESPASASGQIQEHFRHSATNLASQMDIPCFDLATSLQGSREHNPNEKLYFEYDGHLTPEGHRKVGLMMGKWLQANDPIGTGSLLLE